MEVVILYRFPISESDLMKPSHYSVPPTVLPHLVFGSTWPQKMHCHNDLSHLYMCVCASTLNIAVFVCF